MVADEKQRLLKAWKKFIKSGFSFRCFTDRLYRHLIMRCGFIAHFNRRGFYLTYFANPDDTLRFFRQFDKDYGYRSIELGVDVWIRGEYEDINMAMCDVWEEHKVVKNAKLEYAVRERDLAQARELLKKHGVI